MAANIIVQDGQTVWDLAIQQYGGVEGVFNLIKDNPGVIAGVDSQLAAGTELKVKSDPVNTDVLAYYTENEIKPASITNKNLELLGDFSNDYNEDYS